MIYDSHYAILNISGKDGKETSLYLSFIPDKTDKGAVVYECVFLVCLVFLPEQCTTKKPHYTKKKIIIILSTKCLR